MADPAFVPDLSRQPASVDFIDNRLGKHHCAFVNPPVHYNPMSGQYKHNSLISAPAQNHGVLATPGTSAVALQNNRGPLVRPIWTTTSAMHIWNSIFPQAMDRFRSTPGLKSGPRPGYNVRDKDDWDSIYDMLLAARAEYQNKGGVVGLLRKVRRSAADNVGPAVEIAHAASKIAPNDPYATPVLGAVEIVLDAVKNAARVRNQVLEGFGGLVDIFSDVELFLGTFERDHYIWNASMDLTLTTLEAVERSIAFFLSSDFRKGASAFFRGGDYQSDLLQSLTNIEKKSESLMKEALKSHIRESHMYSMESQKLQKQLLEEQRQFHQDLTGGLFNHLNYLLTDHERSRERLQAELNAAHKTIMHLEVQNRMLEQSRLTPPPPSITEWSINQEALLRILDIPELATIDAAFVADKKLQLPPRQMAQAEQIVNTPIFREWMVSPHSARLLVQWDLPTPPRTVAGVSPLSAFCDTMERALKARGPRFLPLMWFCGRHVDAADPECNTYIGAHSMLRSLANQLLRQYEFDLRPLYHDLELRSLQAVNSEQLAKILDWLVRRLSRSTTVVFIIDGVVLFERDEFQAEALPALSSLLRLAADPSVPAAVKVLFASTPGTDVVRAAFEQDGLILDVGTLPRIADALSEERMNREMGESEYAPM